MAYQQKLEESFSVKMTAEDKAFHYDNCYGSYSAICTSTALRKWYKQAKRKEERYQSTAKKQNDMEESRKHKKAC